MNHASKVNVTHRGIRLLEKLKLTAVPCIKIRPQ